MILQKLFQKQKLHVSIFFKLVPYFLHYTGEHLNGQITFQAETLLKNNILTHLTL
jgi:hypothetical protein